MEYSSWNKSVMDKYGELYIKTVAIPLAPIRVEKDGIVYMPDSFSSCEYDKIENGFKQENDIIYAAKKFSFWGPTYLVYIKLKDLIHINPKSSILSVWNAAFCANVSYYKLFENDEGQYATETKINSLNLVRHSCHGGSHLCVPRAPYLTSILQLEQSSERNNEPEDFGYIMPYEAEKLFKDIDFSYNNEIDNLISKCVFEDDLYYYKRRSHAILDPWVIPFLEIVRNNPLIIGEYDEEKWKAKSVQLPAYETKADDFKIEGIDNPDSCPSIILEQEGKSNFRCSKEIMQRIKEIQSIKI